jgi:hypothetical protein
MPIHRGFFGGAVTIVAPTITINAVTNFNQDRATFNATVAPNNATTSVKFQYSTNGSTWTDGATLTGITGGSQAVYSNQTGLAVGTLYYVRAIATNSAGSTTSSSTTFTTWSLKTFLRTTAGDVLVEIPSITPTGGSAIAPSIYEMLAYGGGGSAAYGGGGGGGYRLSASTQSNTGGTQNVTVKVGAGGPYNSGTAMPAPAGESSIVTFGSTSWTAGGGTGGGWLTNAAGTAGSGTNPAHGGGVGYYGYTYISGYNQMVVGYNQWTDASCGCCNTDKFGNCLAYCSCNNPNSPIYGNNPNSPIYSTDYSRYAGGGGGGTDGGGATATYPDVGGNGGPGGGAYGLRGGNGGGGGGTASFGSAGSVAGGSGPIVGTGGTGWWAAGVAGGVTFKYYGP